MLVDTVRAFIDREVKPTVREVEHANEYPEAWIEQMKRIGIYGLAIPEDYFEHLAREVLPALRNL